MVEDIGIGVNETAESMFLKGKGGIFNATL